MMHDLPENIIPKDSSKQVVSSYYVDYAFDKQNNIRTVMDLGCGSGKSVHMFKKKSPDIKWVGLDITNTITLELSQFKNSEFLVYDGVNIPFKDNSFDIIYSNQVFEHVEHPKELLREVHRVLKPGGYFIGSVSQLEPYHAHSLYNYTPYGFNFLINESGMKLNEIRPSIDAITLLTRRGLNRPKCFDRWWTKESILNRIIELFGRVTKKTNIWINATKLLFCGQFCFLASKVDNENS